MVVSLKEALKNLSVNLIIESMMKINNLLKDGLCLAVLAMGVLSCSKDEPQAVEQKPINVELTAVYEPLSVVDYDEIRGVWVENEELRSLKNLAQGWENVPAVGLNNSPLRWGIVNYGSSSLTKFARDEAFGQGFKLDEAKQTFSLRYASTTNTAGLDWSSAQNPFAWAGIGGRTNPSDGNQQIFTADTHPNHLIKGIRGGTETVSTPWGNSSTEYKEWEYRNFPLMSDLVRVDTGSTQYKAAAKTLHLKMRGCLITVLFVNNAEIRNGTDIEAMTNRGIIIRNIKIEDLDNTPLYYSGTFDWGYIANESTATTENELPLKFIGVEPNIENPVFPLDNFHPYTTSSSVKGILVDWSYAKPKISTFGGGILIDPSSDPDPKDKIGYGSETRTCFVWGYPRKGFESNTIKLTVDYHYYPDNTVTPQGYGVRRSKVMKIKAPNGGFKEHYNYRVKLSVQDSGVKVSKWN